MSAMREPSPGLEQEIASAQRGTLDSNTVIRTFVSSTIVVPSGRAFDEGRGQFQPIFFPREGAQMMAVFTAVDRIVTDG